MDRKGRGIRQKYNKLKRTIVKRSKRDQNEKDQKRDQIKKRSEKISE